ncbi:patatin-like phospholipase family protein [Stieleria sp. TO1_6]|uniref:patatin-like phospholipase family protein n=1 Tax=Stieleria tagensis TaxID=2956795 RepID=UPI00209B483C|nr:patatin-like phospholipase family protein [Stieleria tagensis]MCO8124975.1 patatin-like phospholipase family protein [Stieleria tagensis]
MDAPDPMGELDIADFQGIAVCAGLGDPELAELVAACSLHQTATAWTPVVVGTDLRFALCFVIEGRARLVRRSEPVAPNEDAILSELVAGDAFAYSAELMQRFGRRVELQADQHARLAIVQDDAAMQLLASLPMLHENLLNASRLQIERRYYQVVGDDFHWLGLPLLLSDPHLDYPQSVSRDVPADKLASDTNTGSKNHSLGSTASTSRSVAGDGVTGNRNTKQPLRIGIVSTTPRCGSIGTAMRDEFLQRGEAVCLVDAKALPDSASDDRSVTPPGRVLVGIDWFDTTTESTPQRLDAIERCDHVLWCCDNQHPNPTMEKLPDELVRQDRRWASKITCVQLLDPGQQLGRKQWCSPTLEQRDFLCRVTPQGNLNRSDVRRLTRHFRATSTGLALGGGGARGTAHLGALRLFDRFEIDFDRISGTSVGAMIGVGYAAGLTPDFLIDTFSTRLKPHDMLDALPGGRRLFLFGRFQMRAWEAMLREYYHDWSFEQLPVPFSIVTTDLVSGRAVIRESGDLVTAILESINVPILAKPILRAGQMLVDGGVVNNLPASTLRDRGAKIVVGVDVTKEIPEQFNGATETTPLEQMEMPNRFETAYRVMDIARFASSQLQMLAADFVIEPDTRDYDFADFAEARSIAKVGELAAQKLLPEIRSTWITL